MAGAEKGNIVKEQTGKEASNAEKKGKDTVKAKRENEFGNDS